MYTKAKLLEMLASDKSSVRYDACEWIRVSQESSPEIINALVKASHDQDKEVAERANLTLQADIHHQMAIKMGIVELDIATEPVIPTSPSETMAIGEINPSAEEELKAYIGSGWEYYLNAWKPTMTGEGKIGGFNIAGLFFSSLWLSYRKMYRYALIFYGIIIVSTVAQTIIEGLTGKTSPRLLNSGIGLILAIIIGAFGNRLYFNSARRTIAQVNALGIPQEDALKLIAKKGGRSFWAALGLFLLFVGVLFTLVFVTSITINLLKLNPAEAYFNRGLEYYNNGDFDQAISEYNKVIQLVPNNANAYYNRGLAYAGKGDLDPAISDYDKAIQLNPDFFEAYINRGNAYFDNGNMDQAISDFDKAIQLNPDFVMAYYNRGNAYKDKGDLDRAISDFDQAIQLDPTLAQAYVNRGIAYSEQGDLDRAISDYDKAIQIRPDDTLTYFARGNAYRDKGDLDRALSDFDQAIQLNPNLADAYYNRGATYAEKGDTASAIADFKKVLELCGNDVQFCQDAQDAIQQLGGK
jgi:tetratricopeptide (TPR) repeat protein